MREYQNKDTHKITDYFSFYSLPSTVLGNNKYPVLEAAYLNYYATDVALGENADESGALKERLQALIGDALIVANNAKFDVFNAVTMMDNDYFLKELRVRSYPTFLSYHTFPTPSLTFFCARSQFGSGNGFLNYYLYNWRTAALAGVTAIDGVSAGRGIGVVMV